MGIVCQRMGLEERVRAMFQTANIVSKVDKITVHRFPPDIKIAPEKISGTWEVIYGTLSCVVNRLTLVVVFQNIQSQPDGRTKAFLER